MTDDRLINLRDAENIVRFECGEWRGLSKTIIDELEALPSAQPSVSKTETVEDCISRKAALKGLEDLNIASFYELNEHSKEAYTEVKAMLNALPPARSELEDKIRAIGYTGKEGRINIHGRLFAVRELPQ